MSLRDPSDIEADLAEVSRRLGQLGKEYIDALRVEGRSEEEAVRALLTFGAQLQADVITGTEEDRR